MDRHGRKQPLLVAIAGGSGAGKTYLARQISEQLTARRSARVAILSLDNYYIDLSHLSADERARTNFDEPEALDFRLLREHWDLLRQGQPATTPLYDFSAHTRRTESLFIDPGDAVILEGLFALHDPAIRESSDVRVFVEAPAEVCLERRIDRDVRERGRSEESVRERFASHVLPMYQRHVEPTRVHAQFIVRGDEPDGGRDELFKYIETSEILKTS